MQNTCSPTEGQINIVKGQDKVFYVDLFYTDTGEPFDLTAATEIKVLCPGALAGVPVVFKKTLSEVAIVGAPGAGKISVTCSEAKTALLLVNPSGPQFQDLQINVVIASILSIFVIPAVLNISDPPYVEVP